MVDFAADHPVGLEPGAGHGRQGSAVHHEGHAAGQARPGARRGAGPDPRRGDPGSERRQHAGWRFLLVDDKEQIARIGELYRECIDMLWDTIYKEQVAAAQSSDSPDAKQFRRIMGSVTWAQENFATYPLLLFAFDQFDTTGGSIFPAVWSAHAPGSRRRRRLVVDERAAVQERRDARDPRRPHRGGLADVVLCAVRLPDRQLGSRLAVPPTRCPTATPGAPRSASRSTSRCGPDPRGQPTPNGWLPC
ncbi:MAG: hypothetical protein R2695_06865 [Acidimicrobiales bacterium]